MAPTSPLWQQGIGRACPALARLHAKQAPDGNRDLRYSSLAKFEKNSGIDRVIQTAELFQLPAPDFRLSSSRTLVVIYGPRKFEGMDRGDRVRACYQHCALKWVMSERMTNQTLRDRFRLAEGKSAIVSQTIAAAIECGLVKADEAVAGSRKYARYLPSWA